MTTCTESKDTPMEKRTRMQATTAQASRAVEEPEASLKLKRPDRYSGGCPEMETTAPQPVPEASVKIETVRRPASTGKVKRSSIGVRERRASRDPAASGDQTPVWSRSERHAR